MSRLQRLVGDQAVTVTVAGVELAGDQLDGYTIRRGRSSVSEQTTAATCTLNVYAGALPQLPAVGDQVDVELGPDALTWLGITADHPAVPRFVGAVTSARIVPRRFTGTDRDVVQLVAVSPLAQLGRTFIGAAPWPVDLDGQRAGRIFAEALGRPLDGSQVFYTNPDMSLPPWVLSRTDSTDALTPSGGIFGPNAIEFVPTAGTEHTPHNLYFGRPVDVTPGTTYRVTVYVLIYNGAGDSYVGDLALVVGADEYPTTAAQLGDGAVTPLFTVPEGVTSLDMGLVNYGQTYQLADGSEGTTDRYTAYLVTGLTLTEYVVSGPFIEVAGGTVAVNARDVDRQNALGLLVELATDAGGLVLDRRDGFLDYADADDRRGVAPTITLDDSEVLVGSEWATSVDGLVNRATLGYGASDNQPTVQVVDQDSVDAYGDAEWSRGTQLAVQADARRRAARTVGLQSRPAYVMPSLAVDLLGTLTTPEQRAAALSLDQSSLVAVTDFPASGPLTTGQLWVEGYTEQLTRRSWVLDLTVSSFVAGGAGLTYSDVPPAVTYADVPDTVTNLAAWGYDPTIGA